MTKSIGIIGLGRIGMPVACAFLQAGYTVFGCDKQKEKVSEFEKLGGIPLSSPISISKRVSIIMVIVLDDEQVIEVVTGNEGIIMGDISGVTIICMSTINRSNLELVAGKCEEEGILFVDCPFTGGPARVPTGNLTFIAAASPVILESVRPFLSVLGNVIHAGETPGQGQAIKHCHQLLVGATHAATMEVIALARKLGLDVDLVCEVVGKGISGSEYFRLLSEAVLLNKPSPGSLGQMCKDVSIVKNTAHNAGMPAYVATAVAAYFKEAEIRGMQNCEGAELIEIVENAKI